MASSSAVAVREVWKRQCSSKLPAVEEPDVCLGVADVDCEQHAGIIPGG